MKKTATRPTRKITTRRRTNKKTAHKPLEKRHVLSFLPSLLIAASAFIFSITPATQSGVLAYATNVSSDGLLAATNQERSQTGAPALSINSKLTAAAQAKAQDMIARNYWSHNTPDGEQPWGFIMRADYQYRSAGENLAFGFASSNDTVVGWMNSQTHRDNLLNSAYSEVGFGIANSADFTNHGNQTIVVAMYGAPLVAAAPVQQTQSTKPTPTPVEEAAPVEQTPVVSIIQEENTSEEPVVYASTTQPKDISRVQLLTSGNAAWSGVAVMIFVGAIGVLWAMQRGFHLKKVLVDGEHFLLRHVHIDLTVLAFIYLGWVFVSRAGSII